MAPMGCDVSIRCSRRWLDTEQSRFLKGVRDLEPSWLILQHVCVRGDQEVCGGQGREGCSWREEDRGWELLERELGIHFVFVSVFLWKWDDVLARSFWLLSEIRTSGPLCREVRVLKCSCHSICLLTKGGKRRLSDRAFSRETWLLARDVAFE